MGWSEIGKDCSKEMNGKLTSWYIFKKIEIPAIITVAIEEDDNE